MALTSKGGILLDAAGRVYEGPIAAGENALDADVATFLAATTTAGMRTAIGIDGATTVAAVATADATDLATAITLANQLKATLNELIADLKLANIIPAA